MGAFANRIPTIALQRAGSHGLIGKGYSGYRESTHVPLFVYDPRSEYTRDVANVRVGLTSSVDVLRMIATIGNQGRTSWLTNNARYRQLYAGRADLYSMLRSATIAGRDCVLHSYDEPLGGNEAFHVIALRDQTGLYVAYYNWPVIDGPLPAPTSEQYFAASDTLEMIDLSGSAAALQAAQKLSGLINSELRAPLPLSLVSTRADMVNLYQQFLQVVAPSNLVGILTFNQLNW